jgi:hypothetical protein
MLLEEGKILLTVPLSTDMVGLLFVQRMPDMIDNDLRSLWPRFQTTAHQAIED